MAISLGFGVLFATFIVAEGEDASGVPINPALFATDNGGWVAGIDIVDGTLPLTVVNPLLDDGAITVKMVKDVSTPQVCVANVFVTNTALDAKRTIFQISVTVTARDPNP